MTIFMAILFSLTSCKGQDKKEDVVTKQGDKKEMEQPKGTWKVDKEFDENGNLIRYDSIYSWSSSDTINDLATMDKDSLLNNFESKCVTLSKVKGSSVSICEFPGLIHNHF